MASSPANNTASQKQHSSSFGQTLQFITTIKLSELEKQSNSYKAHSAGPLALAQSILQSNAATPATTPEIIKAVEQLSKCTKSWTGSGSLSPTTGIVGGSLQLKNLEFWLQQAQHDPEFAIHGGSEHAKRWLKVLESHIKKTQMRFDAAMLFGKLFNEWIASGDSSAVVYQGPDKDGDGLEEAGAGAGAGELAADAGSTFSEFVEVGRKEMYEQKQKLVSIIFDEQPIDTAALKDYLEDLFSGEEPQRELERLRNDLKSYGASLLRQKMTTTHVKSAINGLLAGGLMDEEKRTTLKAFQENGAAMEELASVLTMRIASLGGKEGWKWPKEGVKVEMRRALNGKYRAFTDPDIIDALLLQHLGIAWQYKLKHALRYFFNSKAWTRPPPVPHHLAEQRKAQLNDDGTHSIQKVREENYRDFFFVSQLTDSLSGAQAYDDLVDVPENQNANNEDDYSSAGKSPAAIKQKLLNIIQTESYLNTALHGTHTILRSDLEWFGPSLPHASILTILEFLGMGKKWVRFYKEFLEAPVKFTGAGGFGGPEGEEEVRVRKRGTPISYSLSVVCGEAVLFVMDYAVNRRSGGLKRGAAVKSEVDGKSKEEGKDEASETQGEGVCLYRMHDDLWLWDRKKENVARAWREMKTFAGLVGLKFNEAKTGSVVVGNDESTTTALAASGSTSSSGTSDGDQGLELPKGDIRWGFLVFSPSAVVSSQPSPTTSSTAPPTATATSPRFVIDQSQVTQHIIELRRQLAAAKSIFGWVNVWNKYMRFFVRNFGAAGGSSGDDSDGNGKMAKCAAERAAVVDVVETLARIQREVFEDLSIEGQRKSEGVYRTALEYLRRTLEVRFGVKDLPDGYFYFPISSGGLEVWNPMVEVLAMERRGKPLIAFEEKEEKGDKAKRVSVKDRTGIENSDSEEGEEEGGVKSTNKDEDDEKDDDDTTTDSYSDWDDDDDFFNDDKYVASSKFPARMRYDPKDYKNLKEIWDTSTERRRTGYNPSARIRQPREVESQRDFTIVPDEFMSREEFEGLREGWLSGWARSYEDMMEYVDTCEVVCVPKVRELIAANAGGSASVPTSTRGRGRGRGGRGGPGMGRGGTTAVGSSPAQRAISGGWEAMSFYERWVTSVYGEEVVERCGGLDVVDQSLIPVGMVQLFRTSRMKLDQ